MDESSTAASEVDAATAAGRYAMSDLFEKYLSSGEGELSMMEALGAMAELVGPTSREFIARFGEVDVDKSGTLSREEFEALYVKMLAQPDVVEAAYTAAALPPPAVSASPPPPLLPSESISALFAKYDTSGDGVLQVRYVCSLSLSLCVCVCFCVCVVVCECLCLSLSRAQASCLPARDTVCGAVPAQVKEALRAMEELVGPDAQSLAHKFGEVCHLDGSNSTALYHVGTVP